MARPAYLTRSAALRPAPATTIVWGEPFRLGALPSFSGLSEKASRKSGKFPSVRSFSYEDVSLTVFATSTLGTTSQRATGQGAWAHTWEIQIRELD